VRAEEDVGEVMPINLRKLAMGIVPYGNKSEKKEEPELSDSDCSSNSTFSRSGSLGRLASSEEGVAVVAHSPMASSPQLSRADSTAGTAERTPDEESILNGWVRRFHALQQQV